MQTFGCIFFPNLDFFTIFALDFPLSYLIGRQNHPSAMPNSKGSIEVHAELKHAMVRHDYQPWRHQLLKRVLGGRSRHNKKGVYLALCS